jgi:tripartite-type tricarboxylate transporter receptor subunit TctC
MTRNTINTGRSWNAPAGGTRRALLGVAGAACAAANARAQRPAWPTQPIRFIGIFPPGGGTDILARIWCNRMAEITGQSFVVENRSGSGGNVGTEAIARATPDGNTIGLASVSSLSIAPSLYPRLPYDVERDFSYICGLWQLPNLLIVRHGILAHSVPELIALCRREPGRYSFGSSGAGTTLHIADEMFKHMGQVNILHVPYRGGAQAYNDLLGGRVDMVFGNIPEALRLSREGQVRPLAVTGAVRSPQAPELPTLGEFLPGYEINSWGGVLGPRASSRRSSSGSPRSDARRSRAPKYAAASKMPVPQCGRHHLGASQSSVARMRRASHRWSGPRARGWSEHR